MKSQKNYLLLVVLGFAALGASAQVYKWVDKNGKVQYTDTPPPENQSKGEAKTLKLPPPGPVDGGKPAAPKDPLKDAVKAKTDKDAEAQKTQKAEVDAKNAKLNADNCREAKSYIASIDTGAPLRKANEKGEREFLDESGRTAERARAQTMAAESCK